MLYIHGWKCNSENKRKCASVSKVGGLPLKQNLPKQRSCALQHPVKSKFGTFAPPICAHVPFAMGCRAPGLTVLTKPVGAAGQRGYAGPELPASSPPSAPSAPSALLSHLDRRSRCSHKFLLLLPLPPPPPLLLFLFLVGVNTPGLASASAAASASSSESSTVSALAADTGATPATGKTLIKSSGDSGWLIVVPPTAGSVVTCQGKVGSLRSMSGASVKIWTKPSQSTVKADVVT